MIRYLIKLGSFKVELRTVGHRIAWRVEDKVKLETYMTASKIGKWGSGSKIVYSIGFLGKY